MNIRKQIEVEPILITTRIKTAMHIYNRKTDEKNINIKGLSEKIGTNYSSLLNYFNCRFPWKVNTLRKIAKVLNVSPIFLATGYTQNISSPRISSSEIIYKKQSDGDKKYYLVEVNKNNEKQNKEIISMKQSIKVLMNKIEKMEGTANDH